MSSPKKWIPLAAACIAVALAWMSNPVTAAALEAVQYRCPQARTVHLHDAAAAQQYDATLKQLGCESRLSNHGGHIDLTYRCADWRQLEAASHDAAHKWEAWLRALNFEVKHLH